MRFRAITLSTLVIVGGCRTERPTTGITAQAGKDIVFDVPALLARYQNNNKHTIPIVSYMCDGVPVVVIYPDGTVITTARPSDRSRSGLLVAQFSNEELVELLANIASNEGLWGLSSSYRLSRASDQWTHNVTVRIDGRPEKKVSVYGNPNLAAPGDTIAPVEFQKFIESLQEIRPKGLKPWDPGYVEVSFSDYSYAPEKSVQWPGSWPSLTSPLVRGVKGWVIEKVMIFPSQNLAQLDSLLEESPGLRAIEINGWKASVDYHWPLPGEKYWTGWNQ